MTRTDAGFSRKPTLAQRQVEDDLAAERAVSDALVEALRDAWRCLDGTLPALRSLTYAEAANYAERIRAEVVLALARHAAARSGREG